ncbi:hypothetical protein D3C75_209870 [compost metagenome]
MSSRDQLQNAFVVAGNSLSSHRKPVLSFGKNKVIHARNFDVKPQTVLLPFDQAGQHAQDNVLLPGFLCRQHVELILERGYLFRLHIYRLPACRLIQYVPLNLLVVFPLNRDHIPSSPNTVQILL